MIVRWDLMGLALLCDGWFIMLVLFHTLLFFLCSGDGCLYVSQFQDVLS